MPDPPQRPAQETPTIWNRLGSWWDEVEGPQGSDFHRYVVGPVAERLLGIQPGESVLDVACGNGQFSRRLAALGATVVAFDVSQTFIERAIGHTTEHAERITYHVADATDEDQIAALAAGPFDAAVANMALMSMADVAPLFRTLAAVLRPSGRFVFTVLHPCVSYPFAVRTGSGKSSVPLVGRLVPSGKQLVPPRLRPRLARRLQARGDASHSQHYLEATPRRGLGISGQPVPYWMFHRPLQDLLAAAFDTGFVVDGLAEPAWANAPGRAYVLAARLRLLGAPDRTQGPTAARTQARSNGDQPGAGAVTSPPRSPTT